MTSKRTAPANADLFFAYKRTGDPKLARRLAEANLGLSITIARSLDRTGGRALPDLIQEGHLGLLEAVRRFDPDRGVAFSTYAAFWIRAFVRRYMRDNARLVRVGRSRADRAAYARGELPPSELPLEARGRKESTNDSLGDRLPDPRPPVDVLLEAAEVALRSRLLVERLDRRERALLEQRLLADEPTPLRRLGRRLSLSGERLRQIEARLLTRLRDGLSAGSLEPAAA